MVLVLVFKAEELYLSPYLPGIGWTDKSSLLIKPGQFPPLKKARSLEKNLASFPVQQVIPGCPQIFPMHLWQPQHLSDLSFQCTCSNFQARKIFSVEYERGRYKRLNNVSLGNSWLKLPNWRQRFAQYSFSSLPNIPLKASSFNKKK